jgi:hypothetical protein
MGRRKTEGDGKRSSSTAGKMKGSNCQKSVAKTYVAKDTKGMKKDWALWVQGCIEISKEKGNLPTQEVIELRNLKS